MKSNEKKTLTKEEEIKIKAIEDITFNSVAVEFKNGKFEKYITGKYILSSDEQKAFKGEIKAIKNIDIISNIEYSEDSKNVSKITNYHLQIFVDNMVKFTKNGFAEILKSIDKPKQLSIYRKILLDYSKMKNTSTKTQNTFVSGAKTLIRRFVIDIITEYCK